MTPVDPSRTRCRWSERDDLYRQYHDEEWGFPSHDDRHLFEMLALSGFQAGLSWHMILKKRPAFREAFEGFDPVVVAAFDEAKVAALATDPGIVRNGQKIKAVVTNARAVLNVRNRHESFAAYLWQFTDARPLINYPATDKHVASVSPEAEAMSKHLIQSGFKFVGPTICYAFMQSVGMIDDHIADCWRKKPPEVLL